MPIFEWDEAKNRSNRRKHRVSFETAQRVFDDPNALMKPNRVEGGEERWQAIGRADAETVLVVAHVVRDKEGTEVIRIISARHALRHEREKYESEAY